MIRELIAGLVLIASAFAQVPAPPAVAQNPSPMADTTRTHRRLNKTERQGRRIALSLGTLFVPEEANHRLRLPLVVHLHGAAWLAEQSAAQFDRRAAVLSVQLGQGSGVYAQTFAQSGRFRDLLAEAARAISPEQPARLEPVVLTAFSAGYGGMREILQDRNNWPLIWAVVLADGLHTGYLPERTPGPIDPEPLQPFVEFARQAVAGRKQMVITHSEIFPGTFASTTECTDYLIGAVGLRRHPVLKWGPGGMQQLSEVRSGGLRILGFAGNSAPDHVDHLQALGTWLRLVKH